MFSSVAVAVTGVTVSGGLASSAPAGVSVASDVASSGASGTDTTDADARVALPRAATAPSAAGRTQVRADRLPTLSRSADRRQAADPVKAAALSDSDGVVVSGSEDLSDADPRQVGMALLGEFGYGQDQFGCLDSLYNRESGWNVSADNPSSSAYGIPQALPGSKMASAGADWATNPVTQIRWGLGYIQDRYGSPCGAWGHSQSNGWY